MFFAYSRLRFEQYHHMMILEENMKNENLRKNSFIECLGCCFAYGHPEVPPAAPLLPTSQVPEKSLTSILP